MFSFDYLPAVDWPPLAWLAQMSPGRGHVTVMHGPRVERLPTWFGEIVWAGDFQQGGLDQTDAIFGTGALTRDSEVVFVSSASTVDRLHSMELPSAQEVWVSNSLPCLLALAKAELDPTDGSFYDRLATMTRGIDGYEPLLPTSAGPVRLTYYRNLVWNGRDLRLRDKPDSVPGGFATFEAYRAYLVDQLRMIGDNCGDRRRKWQYRMVGTVSTGYDSAASAIIARDAAGLAEAITFVRPDGVDAGDALARHIGIAVGRYGRFQWREDPQLGLPEVPFIAGDAKGEDVFFASTGDALKGTLLITGHGGGGLWDRHRSNPAPTFARKDRAGLPLTEWRLGVGFIHLPLPYLGGRHVADLMRIGTSADMAPWDIGGWYTRPIARRIIEEAGVPRELFGHVKRASSILLYQAASPLTPASAADLDRWLRQHSWRFLRRGRLPPSQFGWLLRLWRRLLLVAGHRIAWMRKALSRGPGARMDRLARRWIDRGGRDPRFDYAFAWALEHMKKRYRPAQRDV